MTSREWKDISLKLLEEPDKFSLWQRLIHAAENQDKCVDKTSSTAELKLLRKSYKAFLKKFPLAVNYWITYARWEMKLGNYGISDAIFLEGLSHVGYDLNLWVAYLRFKLETITDNIQSLLELFENARMKIGNHFHSFDFYSLYLSFLKTYSTEENKFHEKSVLLLRLMMDIPLYSYASSFKGIMDLMTDTRASIESLCNFAGEAVMTELKIKNQNKRQFILAYLQSLAQDAYIVNQFNSLHLFTFEKELGNKCSLFDQESSTLAQLETWNSYLNFAEQIYPFHYVTQLYERCLIANSNHIQLANKYVDFIILFNNYSLARNVLRRLISTSMGNSHIVFFLRLADLEIISGHATLARDMITRYISHNSTIPNGIFNKLIDVEFLINGRDEARVCLLVREIISTTNSTSFFKKIRTLPISTSALQDFFSYYLREESLRSARLLELKNCKEFLAGAKRYCTDLELQKLFTV